MAHCDIQVDSEYLVDALVPDGVEVDQGVPEVDGPQVVAEDSPDDRAQTPVSSELGSSHLLAVVIVESWLWVVGDGIDLVWLVFHLGYYMLRLNYMPGAGLCLAGLYIRIKRAMSEMDSLVSKLKELNLNLEFIKKTINRDECTGTSASNQIGVNCRE